MCELLSICCIYHASRLPKADEMFPNDGLKTNLEQTFDHYMVTVCFTPQQKDTKQKKNKRTEEIYRFYMQRDAKNIIPWGKSNLFTG